MYTSPLLIPRDHALPPYRMQWSEGRPTVRDLTEGVKEWIFPIGRLDFDSQGLLILTNDGQLSYRLMHPKYHIPRTYKAIIGGSITNASIDQ
ncbi:MAG: hypothetical protein JSV55_15305, partial [Deltaproteobacteria bacterium]